MARPAGLLEFSQKGHLSHASSMSMLTPSQTDRLESLGAGPSRYTIRRVHLIGSMRVPPSIMAGISSSSWVCRLEAHCDWQALSVMGRGPARWT
jgi:hypothetical protein